MLGKSKGSPQPSATGSNHDSIVLMVDDGVRLETSHDTYVDRQSNPSPFAAHMQKTHLGSQCNYTCDVLDDALNAGAALWKARLGAFTQPKPGAIFGPRSML